MLTDSMRSRLEALNRAPLPATPDSLSSRQQQAQAAPRPVPSRPAPAAGGCELNLPDLLAAGEEAKTASGKHWQIRIPLSRLGSAYADFLQQAQQRIAESACAAGAERHAELEAFCRAFPQRILFLDLETCGFAGSAIFLIGLLRREGTALLVEQILARNYAEERSALERLWEVASRCEVLATFNGKSFDWPMVHDRSTRHLLGRDLRICRKKQSKPPAASSPPPAAGRLGCDDRRPELLHFDLLHHARRRWRKKLPNCKLQTLERFLLGRRRGDDIPGSRIPDAYHHFVRSGETREMQLILKHNFLDLVTLLELAIRLGIH